MLFAAAVRLRSVSSASSTTRRFRSRPLKRMPYPSVTWLLVIATIVCVRVRSNSEVLYLDLPPTRVEDVLVVFMPISRQMSEWPT
ncbi:MAG: hypothetical protein EOS76_06020 [Mesorhizobium sp.]|uniref:hypothetical protein n=2 Tax=Mesorhizobium TaxID=68287 RepID=UPI000F7611A8|nr:hypothetical protein EJ072_05980 [Mesorhizobium sp. M2A.F.Ca.ET.046.03.2.1]AZO71520.1 hypothetical protein EJ067_10330 [Mesorhizobium sp. M1D.F.Ca.ET.043.01.1.1]RVC81995.1 hypothetical protein EN766_02065 [Mesorhizobium sp. M2A.F.Ca.ET.046.02.1.1]RWB39398.1 MAG: hypothetical protein EOQ44_28310 [Mesorhizobium sp.]RWE21056.1 MAG: hypothetical protein EOS76_06020 [Mesorhizobium sp.]